MGAHYDTKTFRSGNSVAVRLPRDLGFAADVRVRLARIGDEIRVRLIVDPAEAKRRLRQMIAELEALPKASEPWTREEVESPDRVW